MKLFRHQSAHLHRPRRFGGFWLSLIGYLATVALGLLLKPKVKQEGQKPADLGDFQFPTATEDRYVPRLWGTSRISGPNVVWWGDLVQEAIVEKVKSGFFSSEKVEKGFRYYVGVQWVWCEGEVDELRRIWVRDEVVLDTVVNHNDTFTIDEPELFGGDDLGQGGLIGTLRFFAGTPTQAPSTYLSEFQQIGANSRTPAYRNVCYLAPDSDPIYVGNSTSVAPWAAELSRIPNPLALTSQGKVNSLDCNPMSMLYEVLTDEDFGNIPVARIDLANLKAVGEVLATEGNGISFVLDSPREVDDLVKLIEEQVDGVLYYDHLVDLFRFKLSRADYILGDQPLLDDSMIEEVLEFSRGAWEETTNLVRVRYSDRDDEYKVSFAPAIDSANINIQDGAVVGAQRNYPGVKVGQLAADLAWRDLRTLSAPLAAMRVRVDATNYDLFPGGVVRVTNADLDLDEAAFRITRVDYGTLEDSRVTLDLVEDVFYYLAGSFGVPPVSNWSPPVDALDPFQTTETLVFEAPRAFNARDPEASGPADNRVWCSARRAGVEAAFLAMYKLDAESSYVEGPLSFAFVRIGELTSDLGTSGANPTDINVTAAPDTAAGLLAGLPENLNDNILGGDLRQMVLIDDELMLVPSATADGLTVDLDVVRRGVLDTVRAKHSAGADVWLIAGGDGASGGATVGPFAETDDVDVKLRPKSLLDLVATAAATEEEVTLDKRSRRPYPPGRVTLGAASHWASSISLEQLGGPPEATGFALSWIRRDYRTAESGNEVEALSTDASVLFADFPAANSTVYNVELFDDPDGTPTSLLTYAAVNGSSQNQLRLAILKATGGIVPSRLRVEIEAEHIDNGETLTSRQVLQHDFDVTSALESFFEFGALDALDVSNLYTADAAGTYSLSLSTAFASGDVEYRVNGGSWTTLIGASGTSGSITGVSVSDTIEIRHNSPDSSVTKQLTMTAPGAGTNAFAVLFT